MKIKTLLEHIPHTGDPALGELDIQHIATDTRQISGGDLFVAVKGYTRDGHHYIAEALSKGAAAVLIEDPSFQTVKTILVDATRSLIPELAQRFYGYPKEQLQFVGITGTNGKSTIAWMIFEVLRQFEPTTGLIGTIKTCVNDTRFQNDLTTPDMLFQAEFQRYLADMKGTHCVMEVSSHAIVQHRVSGLRYSHLVFTHLTPEHLDYHADMDTYFRVKAGLFQENPQAVKLINVDMEWGRKLLEMVDPPVCTLSRHDPTADYYLTRASSDGQGAVFSVRHQNVSVRIRSPFIGSFNLDNALAAVATLHELGHPLNVIGEHFPRIPQVPGRLERYTLRNGARVIVDYAHTPDAFAKMMAEIRPLVTGRLLVLFGAGGNRDQSKRSEMGRIVAAVADRIILTDDNPRHEDPNQIINQIRSGIPDEMDCRVIQNRETAVSLSLEELEPDDLLLLLGKGHETYQVYDDDKQYFSEKDIIEPFTL